MNYLIIGSSACAISALTTLKRLDPNAELTLITQDKYLPYNLCKIIKYTAGLLNTSDLSLISEDSLKDLVKISYFNSLVENINLKEKLVEIYDNNSGQKKILHYDKLLLALGAKYEQDQNFIAAQETFDGLFSLYNRDDSEKIKKYLSEHRPVNIAIIGAGLTGLECADALAQRGFKVTIIEKNYKVLSSILNDKIFDNEVEIIAKALTETRKVEFKFSDTVKEYFSDEVNNENSCQRKKIARLKLDSGEIIKADIVIWAAGVRPNVQLAKMSGLFCARGISINKNFKTSDESVFAAGDCAELSISNMHQNIDKNISCTWPTAIEQGIYAAHNLVGQNKEYSGIIMLITSNLAGLWFVFGRSELESDKQQVIKQEATEFDKLEFNSCFYTISANSEKKLSCFVYFGSNLAAANYNRRELYKAKFKI